MELVITYLDKVKATYTEAYNSINIKEEPFSLMGKNRSLEDYGFKLDGNDIEIEKIFHFAVKASQIGDFHFFINKDEMEKEALIAEISKLKEVGVQDVASAKKKIQKLLKAFKGITIYFALVNLYEESYFNDELLKSIMGEGFIYFNAVAKKKVHRLPKTQQEKEHGERIPIHLGEILSKNRFHFLTILVDGLLLSATIAEAILSFYQDNAGFAIAMLAFAAISLTLITVTFVSYLRKHPMKDMRFLISCIVDVIGLGLGCALFIGFYYMSINNKSTEGLPSLGALIGMGAAIAFGVNLLCVAVACLILKFVQYIKAKNEGKILEKPAKPAVIKQEKPQKQPKPVKAPAPAVKAQTVIKAQPQRAHKGHEFATAFSCATINMVLALIIAFFASVFIYQAMYAYVAEDMPSFIATIIVGSLFIIGLPITLFRCYKQPQVSFLTWVCSYLFILGGMALGTLVYLVIYMLVSYAGEPALELGRNLLLGLGFTFGTSVLLTIPVYLLGSILRKPNK